MADGAEPGTEPGTRPPAVVLLAAGEGIRFTASGGPGHKLLADFRGSTVVGWAIRHAVEAAVGPVYVVVGAVSFAVPHGVRVVDNPRWAAGMATSLSAAVAAAGAAGHTAVVIGLGDQPLVEPEAWRRVARAPGPISIATYGGVRGHPVRLASQVWPLLPRRGDAGARTVMRAYPELVLEVPCPGRSADIDTVEDLARWS